MCNDCSSIIDDSKFGEDRCGRSRQNERRSKMVIDGSVMNEVESLLLFYFVGYSRSVVDG